MKFFAIKLIVRCIYQTFVMLRNSWTTGIVSILCYTIIASECFIYFKIEIGRVFLCKIAFVCERPWKIYTLAFRKYLLRLNLLFWKGSMLQTMKYSILEYLHFNSTLAMKLMSRIMEMEVNETLIVYSRLYMLCYSLHHKHLQRLSSY